MCDSGRRYYRTTNNVPIGFININHHHHHHHDHGEVSTGTKEWKKVKLKYNSLQNNIQKYIRLALYNK